LISTLGEKVGWHYGFGCAGIVMVAGYCYSAGKDHLPSEEDGGKINARKTYRAGARHDPVADCHGVVFSTVPSPCSR
jgi:dipeptide/tripeptide permease